jgi:hypothetical protein
MIFTVMISSLSSPHGKADTGLRWPNVMPQGAEQEGVGHAALI